jgi:hypothetical protein
MGWEMGWETGKVAGQVQASCIAHPCRCIHSHTPVRRRIGSGMTGIVRCKPIVPGIRNRQERVNIAHP